MKCKSLKRSLKFFSLLVINSSLMISTFGICQGGETLPEFLVPTPQPIDDQVNCPNFNGKWKWIDPTQCFHGKDSGPLAASETADLTIIQPNCGHISFATPRDLIQDNQESLQAKGLQSFDIGMGEFPKQTSITTSAYTATVNAKWRKFRDQMMLQSISSYAGESEVTYPSGTTIIKKITIIEQIMKMWGNEWELLNPNLMVVMASYGYLNGSQENVRTYSTPYHSECYQRVADIEH